MELRGISRIHNSYYDRDKTLGIGEKLWLFSDGIDNAALLCMFCFLLFGDMSASIASTVFGAIVRFS